jgi:excisionase family DNA binding protein
LGRVCTKKIQSLVASSLFPYFLSIQSAPGGDSVKTDVMTIRELAVYLKMAEKTLYRLAAEGAVPGFKVGGAWRFRKSEIDKWIVGQEKKTG